MALPERSTVSTATKINTNISAAPDEYQRFENLARELVSVSKQDMAAKAAEIKAARREVDEEIAESARAHANENELIAESALDLYIEALETTES